MNEVPIKISIPPDEREKSLEFLKLFKIEGVRADKAITESQLAIFHALVFQPSKRVQVLCSTQIGKSLIVSLACIVLSCIKNEVVCVYAPTSEKSKIIMRYYIDHLGDSPLFYELLDANTKLERLRQEENKERIILRNGGGIFTISANVSNSLKSIESAMGAHARVLIGDENCLIPDEVEASFFRMIAGQGEEAFYCKIGNPFYRTPPYTHFYNSWNDPNYYKIFIDYNIGLKEGRYTHKFIEEARKKPNFDILFENKFPPEDSIDSKGWTPLLTASEIERAMEGTSDIKMFGEKVFGGDVAATGSNSSVIVIRGANIAEIRYGSPTVDIMEFTGQCMLTIKDEKINGNNVFVDAIGVGAGLASRLRELGQTCVAVNGAEKATDEKSFINKRAEAHWRLRTWIKSGGKLRADERWLQLVNIKYKADDSTGRLKIMSKEMMQRHGIESPDYADALTLGFHEPVKLFQPSIEEKFYLKKMAEQRKKENILKRSLRSLSFYKK